MFIPAGINLPWVQFSSSTSGWPERAQKSKTKKSHVENPPKIQVENLRKCVICGSTVFWPWCTCFWAGLQARHRFCTWFPVYCVRFVCCVYSFINQYKYEVCNLKNENHVLFFLLYDFDYLKKIISF